MPLRSLTAALLAVATVCLLACGTGEGGPDPWIDECSSAVGATRAPVVTITSPDSAESFDSSSSINWVLSVSDEDTDVALLQVELLDYSSGGPEDIDVAVPSPDSDGRVIFSMSAALLAAGLNPIHARATDPDDCQGEDDVLVCIDQATCP
jgi:hypothetical protein